MLRLDSQREVFDAINRIRQSAGACVTNFFASPDDVQTWLDLSAFRLIETPSCLLLFRRQLHFERLWYVAADCAALDSALHAALDSQSVHGVLVTDLVGLPRQLEEVSRIFQTVGFSNYATLRRMARVGNIEGGGCDTQPEALAAEDDIPAITAFFDALLDPLRDQIPEAAEIASAIGSGGILLERRGEELAGLLFFETKGFTSHLRYWYVDPRFHNQGIGARLMRLWLSSGGPRHRFVLWVAEDNADSIARYHHYGFNDDRLIDRILIRRSFAQE